MRKLSLEQRVRKLERLISNENVSLTDFDCDRLESVINLHLKKFGCTAEIEDDNADYGFVNAGIYNKDGEYVTDYDISAVEYNLFEITNDDKKVKSVNSYNEIGKAIADHYGKNFA